MKVLDLSGALLDYWVAKAEGEDVLIKHTIGGVLKREAEGKTGPITKDDLDPAYSWNIDEDRCFRRSNVYPNEGGFWLNYSINWELGGPIIDRERIAVVPMNAKWCAFTPGHGGYMGDDYIDVTDWQADGAGETALVAGMRAYVASKYGDTVPPLATEQEEK